MEGLYTTYEGNIQELYSLYAGKSVCDGKAVICGYTTMYLIAAIQSDYLNGWTILDSDDTIVTCLDNELGYMYVIESAINVLG